LPLPPRLPPMVKQFDFDERRRHEFFGAESIAQAVQSKFKESGADFLCIPSHQLFGRLSFYAPELRGDLWEPPDGRYRYPWIDDKQWAGKTALWVSQKQQKKDINKYFQEVMDLGAVEVTFNGEDQWKLYFYEGKGYQPDEVPTSPASVIPIANKNR